VIDLQGCRNSCRSRRWRSPRPALDACRGLALWFIFIDHIPDNVFAWLTFATTISDTTEVFCIRVWLHLHACLCGALREQGWPTTVTRAVRRGWEIYAAFLLLLSPISPDLGCRDDRRYLDETNTAFFFRDPGAASSTPWSCNIRRSTPTYCHLRAAASGLSGLLCC